MGGVVSGGERQGRKGNTYSQRSSRWLVQIQSFNDGVGLSRIGAALRCGEDEREERKTEAWGEKGGFKGTLAD